MAHDEYRVLRLRMVKEQLEQRGITDQRVLSAMRKIARHLFVPEAYRAWAYEDRPLPIGHGQTISQPYMVAVMLEALALHGHERVLEVGTGSGYQAALLGALARQVITVEIIPALAQSARELLAHLASTNVEVVAANGSIGWTAGAPYDAIVVAAASPSVPPSLVAQLREGGRLVLPVGTRCEQQLLRVSMHHGTVVSESLGECAFVPLLGEEGWPSVPETA